jgi:hypothetical protein
VARPVFAARWPGSFQRPVGPVAQSRSSPGRCRVGSVRRLHDIIVAPSAEFFFLLHLLFSFHAAASLALSYTPPQNWGRSIVRSINIHSRLKIHRTAATEYGKGRSPPVAPPRVNAASAPSAAAIAGVPWCHHIRPGPCGAKNLDLRKEQRWANWLRTGLLDQKLLIGALQP